MSGSEADVAEILSRPVRHVDVPDFALVQARLRQRTDSTFLALAAALGVFIFVAALGAVLAQLRVPSASETPGAATSPTSPPTATACIVPLGHAGTELDDLQTRATLSITFLSSCDVGVDLVGANVTLNLRSANAVGARIVWGSGSVAGSAVQLYDRVSDGTTTVVNRQFRSTAGGINLTQLRSAVCSNAAILEVLTDGGGTARSRITSGNTGKC